MKKYTLDEVYTADMTAFQKERYNRVADEFEKLFGEKPTAFLRQAFHLTLSLLSLLTPKRTLLQ